MLEVEVKIEGTPVHALVDTGAQSTIISRATLCKIVGHLKHQGRPIPTMELPKVKLLGRANKGDYRELTITAQLDLTYCLDGHSVVVPTFVQPDSDQECV